MLTGRDEGTRWYRGAKLNLGLRQRKKNEKRNNQDSKLGVGKEEVGEMKGNKENQECARMKGNRNTGKGNFHENMKISDSCCFKLCAVPNGLKT